MRALLVALLALLVLAPAASAQYEVIHQKYVPVLNSAGERIAVDLWLPARDGKPVDERFPVIVEQSPYRDWQTPYPTKGENPSNGGNPTEWAQRGYVFVFGDVPGTGGSEGTWCLWCREQVDSAVSILEWAAGQPWSNGRVGWYGSSYPGILGLLVAQRRPPALKALRIGQPYGDLYDDFAYIGGVQRGEDMAFLAAGFTGLSRTTNPYCAPAAECPADAWVAAFSGRQTAPPPGFAQDFFGRTTYDDWYRERSVLPGAGRIEAPTLLMAGWEDMFSRGTVNVFSAIRAEKRLVMSASTHVPLFPAADALEVHRAEEEAWFDRHLRGAGSAREARSLRLFTENGPGWRDSPTWPPPSTAPRRLFLGEGTLQPDAPAEGEDTRTIDPSSGRAGGRWLFRTLVPDTPEERFSPDNPGDQNAEAPSVITYATEPLDDDLELTGVPVAHLVASTTAADTQLNVRLVDVAPDGFAYLVDAGWLQASLRNDRARRDPPKPGERFNADVELFPLSYVFRKGHRLRVDIAFADSPRMTAPRDAGETTIHRGASSVDLPVAGAAPPLQVRGRCAARPPRPTIRRARLTRRQLHLRGRARGSVCGAVKGVEVKVDRRRWRVATGAASWSLRIARRFRRGRHLIRVRTTDVTGARSRTVRIRRRVR